LDSEPKEHLFAEAFDAYRDADGLPKSVPSAVLFLDVLGTSEAARAADVSEDDAERDAYVRSLVPAMEAARSIGMLDVGGLHHATAYFTDNIVCAAPLRGNLDTEHVVSGLIVMAGRFQIALACHGFFCRGGVAFGWHYMDPGLAFGPAVLEAVELEKRAAMTPRVALTELVGDLEKKHMGYYFNGPHAPQRRLLLTDPAGRSFVSYLDVLFAEADDDWQALSELKKHQQAVSEKLDEFNGDPAIGPKYRWVASYHNWFCGSLRDDLGREYMIDEARLPLDFQAFGAAIPVPGAEE
jgi:hypothetical protein